MPLIVIAPRHGGIPGQTQRRPGRIAQAVAVNCWYWTKAIAFMREPRHFHNLQPARACHGAIPVKPGSLAMKIIATLKKSALRACGRGAATSEKCGCVPAAVLFSAGRSGSPRRDALGLSHLTHETTRTITCHQLDQPPFPCSINLPLPSRGVNISFRRRGKDGRTSLPMAGIVPFAFPFCPLKIRSPAIALAFWAKCYLAYANSCTVVSFRQTYPAIEVENENDCILFMYSAL